MTALVSIETLDFGKVKIQATTVGLFSVHPSFAVGSDYWTVTHTASGFSVFHEVATESQATERAEHLMQWREGWSRAEAAVGQGIRAVWLVKPEPWDAICDYVRPLLKSDRAARQKAEAEA